MAIVFGDPKAKEIVKRDKQLFPERQNDDLHVQCPDCGGDGEAEEEECPHCGSIYAPVCETCRGTGKITKAKAEKLGQEKLAKEAARRDKERLMAWNSGEPIRA